MVSLERPAGFRPPENVNIVVASVKQPTAEYLFALPSHSLGSRVGD